MLIRSQDKELIVVLENISTIYIINFYKSVENYYKSSNPNTFIIAYNEDIRLGEYLSKEKAIKVLDMIQDCYYKNMYSKFMTTKNETFKSSIFQMPLDNEV